MPVPEIGNDFFFIIFKMFHSFNQPVIVTKLRFMLFTSIVHECDVQKNLINDTCKSLNSMQKLKTLNELIWPYTKALVSADRERTQNQWVRAQICAQYGVIFRRNVPSSYKNLNSFSAKMREIMPLRAYLLALKALWNLKMSAKLSGAQNVLSASARSRKNWAWARAQPNFLSALKLCKNGQD